MTIAKDTPPHHLTPTEFLELVADAEPGWSERLGGPVGVATLCAGLQEQLMAQSEAIASVRVAAIRELLKTRSGREVAAMFGVSPAAISEANTSPRWEPATW